MTGLHHQNMAIISLFIGSVVMATTREKGMTELAPGCPCQGHSELLSLTQGEPRH